MKTAEEIYPYLENEESSIGIREHNQRMYDCRQAYNKGFAAAQFAAPPPASEGDMEGIAESYASKEYKKGSIEMWRAEENLMWVNRKFDFIEGFKAALATLPTREQGGWISVDERPLFTTDDKGNWTCTIDGDREFIAAVPFTDKNKPNEKKLWWIKHCVIEDEIGLCIVGEVDNEPAGWDMSDIVFWQPLPSPPKH